MEELINSISLGENITVFTGGGPVTGKLVSRARDMIVLQYYWDHDYQEHTILRSAIVAITRTYSKVPA